jgi:hypothetical protein
MSRKRKTRDAVPRNARDRENQLDAFAALALMRREGLSASSAAKAEGTTVNNILKYARPALRKRGEIYVAKPSDGLVRQMKTLDARGVRLTVVRSSKASSLIGKYWNAVDDALKGKPSALREFRGKKIPYNKRKFLTNLKTLHRLADAGLLDNLKDIYWHGRKR